MSSQFGEGHKVFPIEGFADIKVNQEGKLINLRSYKYPANVPDPKALVLAL